MVGVWCVDEGVCVGGVGCVGWVCLGIVDGVCVGGCMI